MAHTTEPTATELNRRHSVMVGKSEVVIDQKSPFQFICVDDCGAAHCPHCGAEGRYIYTWAEYGVLHSAMAGCFKVLTRNLPKNDIHSAMERIAVKQSRNKALNGWDKTILRMQQYINDNSADNGKVRWATEKIYEAIKQSNDWQRNKR